MTATLAVDVTVETAEWNSLLPAAAAIAEYNGVHRASHIRDKIVEMKMELWDEVLTRTGQHIDIVKELDKEVLSKGAWTTVLYRYQDWEPRKEAYSKDKYSIRRYQKRGGEYQQKSKFNISSPDQARQLIAALEKWLED